MMEYKSFSTPIPHKAWADELNTMEEELLRGFYIERLYECRVSMKKIVDRLIPELYEKYVFDLCCKQSGWTTRGYVIACE